MDQQVTLLKSVSVGKIQSGGHSHIKIFSFFTGAGFLDLGFEKSGFDVAFVNENHEAFLNVYKYARTQMGIPEPELGYDSEDIELLLNGKKKIDFQGRVDKLRKSGNVVGFIGGPPCPDFSIGGKNKGRHGDNGKLTRTYTQLIVQGCPDFFLFENVKGLYRTFKHRTFFEEMKRLLEKNDYILSERLINAIEYGAPQDRQRIILVGFHRVFLEKNGIRDAENAVSNFPWMKYVKFDAEKIMNMSEWPDTDKFGQKHLRPPAGIIKELTVQHWFEKNEVEKHSNRNDFFQPRAGLKKMQSIAEGDDYKKSYKRLHRWRYSPTAAYGNNEVHLHPFKPRRITAAEALAIQTLPKEFKLPSGISLTDKFKTIGNGVPFVAASGLARTIRDFLEIDIKRKNVN